MITKSQRLGLLMSVSISVTCLVTTEAEAQSRDELRQAIANYYSTIAALNSGSFVLENPGMRPRNTCNDMFTVDDMDGDPHIDIGDKFLITGPIANSGNYQITALPPHAWKGPPKHFYAEATGHPDWFDIYGVTVVAPHNGMPEREHVYRLQVVDRGNDRCPNNVIFWFVDHVPADTGRDPGHATAGR